MVPPAALEGRAPSPQPLSASLIIDGAHLRAALDAYFPSLPTADVRTLMEGLLRALERTFRVTLKDRVMHEATPSGQPSAIGRALAGLVDIKTRPLSPSTGRPVDPNTLEPIDDVPESTLLIDTGLEIAMSMDLFRHLGKGNQAAIVITSKGGLSEALEMARNQGIVWVCGLRKALCPTLNTHVKEGANLDEMLERAAERLWTQWPARRCTSWKSCPCVANDTHNERHAHACPDWAGCNYVRRKPNGETKPFTRSKIEHLSQFLHPCAHSHGSSSAGSCHNKAWVHPAWSPGTTPSMSKARWHWDGDTLEEDWLNVVRFALVGGRGSGPRKIPYNGQDDESHTDEEVEEGPVSTQERDDSIFSMSL